MTVIDLEGLLHVFQKIVELIRDVNASIVKIFFDQFPERPFSTATLNVKDLTVDMLVNALAHHMQSNKFVTINDGLMTNLVITKIESDGRKRSKQTKVDQLYKNLGKGRDERGGVDELKKYGRDFSLGTFNINYDDLGKKCSNACFAVCLLIRLHYLKKKKQRVGVTFDEVLNEEEILDFYKQIGKGRVSCAILGDDFLTVYEKFKKKKVLIWLCFL